jgi:hypothetical protein
MLTTCDAAWRELTDALLQRGALDEPEIIAILGSYAAVSPEKHAEREATKEATLAAWAEGIA